MFSASITQDKLDISSVIKKYPINLIKNEINNMHRMPYYTDEDEILSIFYLNLLELKSYDASKNSGNTCMCIKSIFVGYRQWNWILWTTKSILELMYWTISYHLCSWCVNHDFYFSTSIIGHLVEQCMTEICSCLLLKYAYLHCCIGL